MINYEELKGTIVAWDPNLGLITLEMFLDDINFFIKEQKELEDEIFELLKDKNCNSKIIKNKMQSSSLHVLKFYVDIIQGIV